MSRCLTSYLGEHVRTTVTIRSYGLKCEFGIDGPIAIRSFDGPVPVFDFSEERILNIPSSSNYLAIEGIISRIETSDGEKKIFLYLIQVRMAKTHSNSEGTFFAHSLLIAMNG